MLARCLCIEFLVPGQRSPCQSKQNMPKLLFCRRCSNATPFGKGRFEARHLTSVRVGDVALGSEGDGASAGGDEHWLSGSEVDEDGLFDLFVNGCEEELDVVSDSDLDEVAIAGAVAFAEGHPRHPDPPNGEEADAMEELVAEADGLDVVAASLEDGVTACEMSPFGVHFLPRRRLQPHA